MDARSSTSELTARDGCASSRCGSHRAPFINFQPVDEPKVGKVRLHIDVLVEDIDAAVGRVGALGGRDTGKRETLPRGRIAVMWDPEGNEFCLLAPTA